MTHNKGSSSEPQSDKLDDALKALSAVADSGEWVAAPYDPKAATVTVGYFGNWRIGRATPGIPGGNYRDMDFGTDEANALLAVELVNAYRAGKLFIRPELQQPSGEDSTLARMWAESADGGSDTITRAGAQQIARYAVRLERELASKARDADHFFQLSGRYLEELNAARSASGPEQLSSTKE